MILKSLWLWGKAFLLFIADDDCLVLGWNGWSTSMNYREKYTALIKNKYRKNTSRLKANHLHSFRPLYSLPMLSFSWMSCSFLSAKGDRKDKHEKSLFTNKKIDLTQRNTCSVVFMLLQVNSVLPRLMLDWLCVAKATCKRDAESL